MPEPKINLTSEDRLTTPEFWDQCYKGRQLTPFNEHDWRNYVHLQLIRLIESLDLDSKSICEVGGGDAAMIAYLGKRHTNSKFSILDSSRLGCELAYKRAKLENVEIGVYQTDLFAAPVEILGAFDLVISHGVVEHFLDLCAVMVAKKQLLNNNGKLLTLIPNLASPIYANLCKRWSKSVFEDHVPHDMSSFLAGHENAGLIPLKSGYLGTADFGILSMAMNGPEHKFLIDNYIYLWLSRLSKAIHFFEYHSFDLPASKLFSPFMYVISSKA